MGIYYLTGLGTSPGAATVPLHYIYLMVKSAENGNEKAQNFFSRSSEIRNKNVEYPESVIIFTSKEIINGTKVAKSGLKDDWFNLPLSKIKSVIKILGKSIQTIIEKCNFKNQEKALIEDIYLIKVNHKSFQDCYEKIYTTIEALQRKELWISYLGGTNQINLALFLASALTGHPTKYIYVGQDDIDKIHPDIPRPDFLNPNINIPPDAWYDLPFLWLGIENKILQEIESGLKWGNDIIHKNQLEAILRNHDLSTQFLAKLQSGNIIQIKDDKIIKGEGLNEIKRFIPSTEVKNLSEWKKWGIKKDLLYKINIHDNFQIEKL